jgi:hypothetical protein
MMLLAYVEQMLANRGERVLLVETAGTEDFEYVRSFYRKNVAFLRAINVAGRFS